MAKFAIVKCGIAAAAASWAAWLGVWRGTALAGPTAQPAVATAASDTSPAPPAIAGTTAEARRIAALIVKLGDPQYPVRQQAQDELAKLGSDAFDALAEAADKNDDLEIAARARYLVHLIRIDWIHDTDSPQVKEALTDYDSKSLRDRQAIVLRLCSMPRAEALEPLCRLIRFEKSAIVAKEGALCIMLQAEPSDTAWPQQSKQIVRALTGSQRAPSLWLLNYVRGHDDPEGAIKEWDKLVADELLVADAGDRQAEAKVQNLLMRHYAQMLMAHQHRDQAIVMMRKMVSRVDDNADSLVTFVDWLVQQKAWEVVDETARQFDRTFSADRTLLYAQAQSFKARGDDAAAETYAKRAFKIVSTEPEDELARFMIAQRLYAHGMVAWCEREYRRIVDTDPPESQEVLRGRTILAEIFHDQDRDEEAAKMLQTLVEQLPKNGELAQKLTNFQMRPGMIRAQFHYYLACVAHAKHDVAAETNDLDAAIREGEQDDPDPDVLIALYRLPNQSSERHKKTLDLIHGAIQSYESNLNGQADSDRSRTFYNEYAWLVANTEGDFDRAIEYSKKSVEMSPGEGELLDTLGHCYAAKKDYDNAVKYQTKAVELDPSSMQVRGALDEFRKARDRAKAAK